ncbi:OmpA family protein [Methylomarinum sp. Ch1-1]|uniref:OmpA family protein n=1 Tax=Methylomarinum roseum TaxID=3067653 RepID=A0AAU7NQH5_9GAMM|nr:OmpA family protein [Methylomarinum sp. Ch1-1]MDP4520864.1 OmpA family protein [Methylomarinum sp. Ch1-1]
MKKPRSLDLDGLDGVVHSSAQLTSKANWSGLILPILLIILLAMASFWLRQKLQLPINTASSEETTENTGIKPFSANALQTDLPLRPVDEQRIDQKESVNQATETPQRLDEELALPTEPTGAGYPAATINNSPFTIHFKFNSSKPILASDSETKEMMDVANRCHRLLRITGYTCNLGSDEVNRHLGLARADAVKQVLMNYGISIQRIETVSAGENNPIASNATPSGRAKNRRAELKCLDQ